MQYQNTSFAAGRSAFVHVNPQGANDELIFQAKTSMVPVLGGKIAMTSASITLNRAKEVTAVATGPSSSVNNSVKLSYNIVKGDAGAFDALEAEVLRVLALARTKYNLDAGLVPTGTADFTSTP